MKRSDLELTARIGELIENSTPKTLIPLEVKMKYAILYSYREFSKKYCDADLYK